MQELKNLATFEVKISGVSFRMHRRSTALMLMIGNPSSVFGKMAQGATPKEDDAAMQRRVEFVQSVCEVALIEVGGVPVKDTPVPFGDLAHVADALTVAFLGSGLEVDPTPES